MQVRLRTLFIWVISISYGHAQFYAEGDLGFARYRSDFLQSKEVTPGGLHLGVSAGYNFIQYLGAEIFYGRMRTKTSVTHDFLDQYIHYDNDLYGLGIRGIFNGVQLRLGYAFHSITPYNKDYPADETLLTNTATTHYGTDNQTFSSKGFYYGFIVDVSDISPTMTLGIGSTLYNVTETGSNFFSFTLGLRYSFGAKKSSGG